MIVRHVLLATTSALALACGSPEAERAHDAAGGPSSEAPVADDAATRPPADVVNRSDAEAADADADDAPGADVDAAADVIRRYYAAIRGGDYAAAHGLWSDDGAASGESLDSFAAGFARTADVHVEIGEMGRVEGAAGSRYVEIPVVVRAVTDDGERQRFEGAYTMRRSVVPGATPDQREWRIHSAELRAVP